MIRHFGRVCFALAFVLTGLWSATASSQDAGAPAADEVDVLITFKTHPRHADHDKVSKHGGKVKHSYWIVPTVSARVPRKELKALAREQNIKSIEEDIAVQAHDAELDNAWGVNRIGSEIAHLGGYTAAGVRVAVIDTGIDYTHPDLDANYRGGWDFVNNDADPKDDHGHGTHVAGTIAAEDNGTGVVGVAPQAELYALKVLNSKGSGSFSTIIAAVQWCALNGIHVTNNSYGSSTDPGSVVRQAFDNANALGIVMVASAGNSGTSAGTENTVGYPAQFDSVIAVAATTSGDSRASYSSTGPTVEIAAPGSSIYSTKRGGGYTSMSGTSMACPHMAGAAAVLIGGGLTNNNDIRYVLAMTSVDLGTTGLDTWYGYGRIDLAAALSALETLPPEPEPEPTPDPEPPTIEVATVYGIGYVTYGGKKNDKHLQVLVAVADEYGAPILNASVAVRVTRNGSLTLNAQTVTDGSGVAVFSVNNAKAGTYSTLVTSVVADGFEWDGDSPGNSFVK